MVYRLIITCVQNTNSPFFFYKKVAISNKNVDNIYRIITIIPHWLGGVPEWPKGSDCKSDAKASLVRIQPPPPVNPYNIYPLMNGFLFLRVWYNGSTSAFQADDAGSIPATRSIFEYKY